MPLTLNETLPSVQLFKAVPSHIVNDSNVTVIMDKKIYKKNETIHITFIPKSENLFLATYIPYFGSGWADPYYKIYRWNGTNWVKFTSLKYFGVYPYCKNGKWMPVPLVDAFHNFIIESFEKPIDFEWNQTYEQMIQVSCENKTAYEIIEKDVPLGKYKLVFSYAFLNLTMPKYTKPTFYNYEGREINETSLELEFEIMP